MLKICESFAIKYDVMFNERKTTAIKFSNKSRTECHLSLNVSRIGWTNEIKHLGNIVTVECTDMKDCTMKRSQLICAVNMFI